MSIIFLPSNNPTDWKVLLADPEKQWRTGYSARTLAHAWDAANGDFPPEVGSLFQQTQDDRVRDLELLVAFPEWKVHLPPKGHPSQNDLFVLARGKHGLAAIMVEGKVAEPFGDTLAGWLRNATPGKRQRLSFIQSKLGLAGVLPPTIRYQLLHRTVSAMVEAGRFNASCAVMLVHSFSQDCRWFEDFQAFLSLWGIQSVDPGKLYWIPGIEEMPVFAGWVTGDPAFLLK